MMISVMMVRGELTSFVRNSCVIMVTVNKLWLVSLTSALLVLLTQMPVLQEFVVHVIHQTAMPVQAQEIVLQVENLCSIVLELMLQGSKVGWKMVIVMMVRGVSTFCVLNTSVIMVTVKV
jgi:hypothetical protein